MGQVTTQTSPESTATPTEPAARPDLPLLTPHGGGTEAELAAAAARRVVDSLLRAGNPDGVDLTDLTARLHAVADELDEHAPGLDERLAQMWEPTRPLIDASTGTENPGAPLLQVFGDEDGWVEGRVTLGLAQQGQPGISHGGYSALMVDHTMGVANNYAKNSGMTARLVLNYRKPVPLFTPLTVRAKQVRAEGRKIFTEATMYANGEVCIEAEALFIQGHMPRPNGKPARADV